MFTKVEVEVICLVNKPQLPNHDISGMHLGMGGNPYGPAGTGKTESVKALGNLFGRQVLVFNCDEGIDVKSMGRIFVGLCKIQIQLYLTATDRCSVNVWYEWNIPDH